VASWRLDKLSEQPTLKHRDLITSRFWTICPAPSAHVGRRAATLSASRVRRPGMHDPSGV
jgi:hypothetical protein